MKVLVALAVGYVIGAQTGRKDLDQLTRSLKALSETAEFGDVVTAARSHVGHALRDLADLVDGDEGGGNETADLVDRVKRLVGRD